MNHENNKGKSIYSVEKLSTVVAKPSYLQQISNASFFNADMKRFVDWAQSISPSFWIVHCGGVLLVVQRYYSYEQIVFLSSSGFLTLEIEEYHGSSLKEHLGANKILELLYQYIWWSRIPSTITQFCKQFGLYAPTKDSTQYAHGELQPLPVPTEQFHSYTLEFVTDLTLNGASTVFSQFLIISPSLHISYLVPWGKTNCLLM